MKKDNERETTLNQLKKRRKVVARITMSIEAFIVFIFITNIVFIIFMNKDWNPKFVTLCLFLVFVDVVFFIIFDTKIKNQIKEETRRLNTAIIKNVPNNRNVKNFLTLVDEDLLNTILSSNIQKFELQEIKIQDSGIIRKAMDCKASIYLKNGVCLSPIYFSEKGFWDLIDKKSKEAILDKVIESIEIQDMGENNTNISIAGQNFCCKYTVSDDELLEIFKIKR